MWFAWKFVPLWYQQQPTFLTLLFLIGCDLLENSYLCGISNNTRTWEVTQKGVVICLKIRTFVVSATTSVTRQYNLASCDLLENSYLCGISNNVAVGNALSMGVVICLKIRTFVVSATTSGVTLVCSVALWFAWKFVPLWYQQQLRNISKHKKRCCDLLENSYLCGISNNYIRITLTASCGCDLLENSYLCGISNNTKFSIYFLFLLWFAWKFVPLWYQQQQK